MMEEERKQEQDTRRESAGGRRKLGEGQGRGGEAGGGARKGPGNSRCELQICCCCPVNVSFRGGGWFWSAKRCARAAHKRPHVLRWNSHRGRALVAPSVDADTSADLEHKFQRLLLQRRLTLLVVYFTIAILTFSVWGRWSVLDSLYFAVVTLTTVGYGDLCPVGTDSKLLTCFFALSAVGLFSSLLAGLASQVVAGHEVPFIIRLPATQRPL